MTEIRMCILEPMQNVFTDNPGPGSTVVRTTECGHLCWCAPSMAAMIATQPEHDWKTVCDNCAPAHVKTEKIEWQEVPGSRTEFGSGPDYDKWIESYRRKMEKRFNK